MKFFNLKIILSVVITFYSLTASIYLTGAEQFKYEGKDRRDPFVPLVNEQGKITTSSSAVGSIKDIVLEGIVWDPKGGSIVIINQNILKEQDFIGDYQLTKIESDRVILKKANKEYVVELVKEGEE